ncbi:MAG: SDR family NAD(P)-dependent oxidoreductase [Terracidiphilus sp.]|jgi:NADP-dependent 3-hydroxy acid dehydrogenase YdfG
MEQKPVYFITGATSGIGKYLAHHYARKDFALVLHGRSDEKLSDLQKELTGADITIVNADLMDFSQIERMFKAIQARHSYISVLINNAFGKLEDSLVEAAPEDITNHVQTSIAGTSEIIKLSVPLLARNKPGFIINIVADWGIPTHNILTGPSVYVATKYAVYGLGVALQMELGDFGIRTTNLCPGVIAATTSFGESDASFIDRNGDSAIHPATIANAIDFVVSQRFAHLKTIVISPTKSDYTGF